MDPGQPLRHLTPARPRSKPGRGSTGSTGQPRGLSLPLLEEDLFLHLSPVCLSIHSSVPILPIFYPSTHSSSICIVFYPSNRPPIHHPSIVHLSIIPLVHPPTPAPSIRPSFHPLNTSIHWAQGRHKAHAIGKLKPREQGDAARPHGAESGPDPPCGSRAGREPP